MLKDASFDSDSENPELEGIILPCQMRPALSPLLARSGERLLMLAVLSDAINIFLRGAAERRLQTETRNWICGGKEAGHAVSFEDACDALGIDPDALRHRLFALKYGDSAPGTPHRRGSLAIKPPAMSRGPLKVMAGSGRRSARRRVSSRA